MLGGGPPIHLMWSSSFNPDRPKTTRKVDLRRILALFRPYAREEALVLVCILIGALLGLLPALFTKWLIDGAIPAKDMHGVWLDVGGMVATALVAGVLGVGQGYLNSLVGEGIMRDIRTSLVAHLHTMPLAFFTGTRTGEIMNRVSSDVDNVDNVVTGTLVTIVTNVLTIVTTVPTLFILDWRLAIVALIIIPLMILPLSPVGRRMYEVRKKTREKRDEIESITQETLSISGITLIKSFVRERFERERFYKVGSDLMKLEIRLAMVGRWFIAAITAMVVAGPALVWLIGSWLAVSGGARIGWLALGGGLTVGTIVAFVQYLNRLYTPASSLAGVQVQIVSAFAVFERIFEYLDMKPEGDEKPDALALHDVRGEVAFEDVRFQYTPDRTALDGVTFRVQPGQMAAFVGPSGAGKTTITQPGAALLRPAERHGAGRRPRRARPHAGEPARKHRDRDPGDLPLPRHDRRQSALRPPDATDEEMIAAARAAQHPRLHRAPARGLQHGRGRARPQALGRRAPAPGDRARAAEEPAHPDPRRSHQRPGLRQRGR